MGGLTDLLTQVPTLQNRFVVLLDCGLLGEGGIVLALQHVDLIVDTVQLLLLIKGELIASIHNMNIIL